MSQLPQSTVLSEASPESLQELWSRDPEGYQQQDIDRTVAEMRLHRERLEKAALEGKKPRQIKVLNPSHSIIPSNPSDLGI